MPVATDDFFKCWMAVVYLNVYSVNAIAQYIRDTQVPGAWSWATNFFAVAPDIFSIIAAVFRRVRKITKIDYYAMSVRLSTRPSVRMEQLDSQLMDFL